MKQLLKIITLVAASALGLSSTTYAQFPNLADLTGVNIDIPNQRVSVGAPDPVGFVHKTFEAVGNLPGTPLAGAIRLGQSRVGATYAIPAQIYQQLIAAGISDHTMRRARFSTNWSAVGDILNGDVVAVTLDDVIVFRDPNRVNDPVLWAHELRHVDQYERMGVDTFAAQYTVNAWVLENEAKDQENRVYNALIARNNMQPTMGSAPSNQNFAYFALAGQLYYGDANGLLYPADQSSGRVLGPAVARVYASNGAWVAVDQFGNQFFPQRIR